MKQSIVTPNGVPTANLAINKSRIKIYNKVGELPTYYLEKGQEFQIELFNPTVKTVLAKITLNGTAIAQGGLVLRPGERVFLERYIDVAKKFKFDTYEVSNTEEVKKAIAENGDLEVQFYRESEPPAGYWNPSIITLGSSPYRYDNTATNNYHTGTPNDFLRSSTGTAVGSRGVSGSLTTTGLNLSQSTFDVSSSNIANSSYTTSACLDSLGYMDGEKSLPLSEPTQPIRRLKKSKSVETGRVEMGSQSSQKLEYVSKTFDSWPIWTVSYKILPISQKVNTTEDLHVKRYCTNCGAKQKAEFKFCPSCGTKS